MKHDQIRARLTSVFRKQDFSDASLRALDEFDEVPLFLRRREIEFMALLPECERGPCMFEVAVAELDRTAEVLHGLDDAERYFMSLTFFDWDGVREGTHLVPTPSLLVSPRCSDELPSFELSTPRSAEAKFISRKQSSISKHRRFPTVCVAYGPATFRCTSTEVRLRRPDYPLPCKREERRA